MQNQIPRTFVGTTTFTVDGMTSQHCRNAVREEIRAVPGVRSVDVDIATGTVKVTASGATDRADIATAVGGAGFTMRP